MKRLLTVLCIAFLLMSALAGCKPTTTEPSGGSPTPTVSTPAPTTAPTAAPTATPAKQKAVITMIQNKVEIQEQLEAAAKEFNSSQNEVQVQILGSAGDDLMKVLQSQFASSPEKAPTIFTAGSGSEFEQFFNYMAPLDSTKASKLMVKGQAEPAMKDGKLYGLPLAIEGFGLVYNKTLFKAAGVDPANIKSMDDLIKASESLEKVQGVEKALAFAKESYFIFMHPFNWPFAVMKMRTQSLLFNILMLVLKN
jgi:raffinose/stachyose/melibiose transport system substrate-binding protein